MSHEKGKESHHRSYLDIFKININELSMSRMRNCTKNILFIGKYRQSDSKLYTFYRTKYTKRALITESNVKMRRINIAYLPSVPGLEVRVHRSSEMLLLPLNEYLNNE